MDTKEKMEQVQQSEDETGVRKGPWSVEEDTILANYVANHSDGSWNFVARSSGLKRSGKSCRLRWLNYLRPGVRHGNITVQEQIMILDLHSRWGNRWSKIARHLPGRTDNEIKNYWRTRVIKQANKLKCDINSEQFKDVLRYVWMPLLIERIQPPPVQLDPNPCASAAPILVHHQHWLQNSCSGSEWINQTYSSCDSGTSSNMDLQVHSEQLGHNVSGLCQSFNNQMFEPGNSLLLESLWNDENIWLTCDDDLEIKDSFLA